MSSATDHPATLAIASADPLQLRRADNNERFVAFAFAGGEMMVEIDTNGIVTYAAGAFRSKFGRPPESFVDHPLRDLVAPVDHEVLGTAVSLLTERSRLQPLLIRLSDAKRTPLAIAGIALRAEGRPLRLCLSFARPPAPLASARPAAATPHAFARAAEARLRAGAPCDLNLIEIAGHGNTVIASSDVIGQAIESAMPDTLASEIAPGRFGLLGAPGTEADLFSIADLLEKALRQHGVDVSVEARHLPLATKDLTSTQTVRALRQALNVFARDGAAGLGKAGFDGGLAGYMRRARTQVTSLRRAIRDDGFSLAFQPIVSLADSVPHHYEALIRPRPIQDCSFSGPQDFVMLVEALGLADELDLAVARVACEAAANAGTPVAFNLSGQSVQSPGFRDRLIKLLTASPARKAGLIVVEMTETAELEDVAEVKRTAEALRSLNIKFCLDDFGAGAADIRLLRALSPDIVKLDGSYIPGIVQDGRERAFVAGMIEIARAAKAEIVAEGIEIAAEADALRALGAQYGQGWLFGRPGPLPSTRPDIPRGAGRTGEVKEVWG